MKRAPVDVSVIVAVRNGGKTLNQCLKSIVSQEKCHIELIVVDCLSDDETREIVNRFGEAVNVYIRESDSGIYDAWNKALLRASGMWCSFLGSDDFFYDNVALHGLLDCAQKLPVAPVLVFGGVIRTGGAENQLFHPNPQSIPAYLRSGRMVPHPGALHLTSALNFIGRFNSSYRIAGDFDAAFRLASMGQFARSSSVICVTRIGGISTSRNTRSLAEQEFVRVMREHVGCEKAMVATMRRRIILNAGRTLKVLLLAFLGKQKAVIVGTRLGKKIGYLPNFN